ncbi:MAG: hypothetical protein LBQ70_04510 [Prevotellaceae bacterium]|nr:hypothetical protein [Prevotellaceae bacterium]
MEAYNKSIMEYDDVVLAVDYAEEIGEKRGEKRGIKKGKTDVVISAYRIGLSVEEIAAITNFTVEQVEDILSKNAR